MEIKSSKIYKGFVVTIGEPDGEPALCIVAGSAEEAVKAAKLLRPKIEFTVEKAQPVILMRPSDIGQ